MGEQSENEDPRITPPKQFGGQQQSPGTAQPGNVGPQTGGMEDEESEAAGSRDDAEIDEQDEEDISDPSARSSRDTATGAERK
jgi:hypothetical protein